MVEKELKATMTSIAWQQSNVHSTEQQANRKLRKSGPIMAICLVASRQQRLHLRSKLAPLRTRNHPLSHSRLLLNHMSVVWITLQLDYHASWTIHLPLKIITPRSLYQSIIVQKAWRTKGHTLAKLLMSLSDGSLAGSLLQFLWKRGRKSLNQCQLILNLSESLTFLNLQSVTSGSSDHLPNLV